MSNIEVPFHLDIIGRALAGTVFGNLDERVVVVRFEDVTNAGAIHELTKLLHDELDMSRAETLFVDTRSVGGIGNTGLLAEAAAELLAHSGIKQVAWLCPVSRQELPNSLLDGISNANVTSCVALSFEEATSTLTAGRMYFVKDWKEASGFDHFEATYGGSCAYMPALKTTVLRSAGNIFDFAAAQEMYERAFRLHAVRQASVFIVDTSAIAPIEDLARYAFAFDALITPIVRRKDMKQVIHLRAGDPIFPPGASTPMELASKFKDVEFMEASSMTEACRLIRLTRGMPQPK